MATYQYKDTQLLTEAYSLQLLKENMPAMTLSQVSNNLDLLTESELEYTNVVLDRILNEFFGGAGNVLKGAWQGVKNVANSAAKDVKNLGAGAVAGAKEIGQNVGSMYNSGNESEKSKQLVSDVMTKIRELIELIKAVDSEADDRTIMQTSLDDIIATLLQNVKEKEAASGMARDKGVFGGVGNAAKAGYQASAAGRNPSTPPPLPRQAATPPPLPKQPKTRSKRSH